MKNLSKFTRVVLAVGLVLLLYGYLCRLAELYFFWESKAIGWALLFIGLIGLLADRIRLREEKDKTAILEKIGIGIIVFMLLIQTILISVTPFTDAYSVAKVYIQGNEQLNNEIGSVQGFWLMPMGGVEKTTDSNGTYGSATINLIVKGQRKFRDVTVYVVKYADQDDWIVERID